jgi:hypothetical protein
MALSVASIKAVVKAKSEAEFGVAQDAALADKDYTAQAEILFEVLTSLAIIELNNGGDTNGDSLIDKTGVIK